MSSETVQVPHLTYFISYKPHAQVNSDLPYLSIIGDHHDLINLNMFTIIYIISIIHQIRKNILYS